MNAKVIIDNCLREIGEADPATPVELTRAECLDFVNHCYQELIGPRLNKQTSATLTVTAGVASVPADYLAPVRLYDGTTLLEQIFDIDDKVEDTDDTSQFWVPNETQIYLFGITPAGTVTLYYKAKPTAVTDSTDSTPTDLKARYHIGPLSPFVVYIKSVIAGRRGDDSFAFKAELMDILDDIETEHSQGRSDNEPLLTKGWL